MASDDALADELRSLARTLHETVADDERRAAALDLLRDGTVDLVVNIPKDASDEELRNDYAIRRAAVDHGIPLITNIQLAQRLATAVCNTQVSDLEIRSWNEY